MQTADTLMLSGVVAYCPDCEVEAIFVPPDVDDRDPAEHACTLCGAALLIDMLEPAGCDRVRRAG